MKTFIEIIGWIGAFEVVGAYLLLSIHKIEADGKPYQWLNLSGGILLIANTIYLQSYPSTFINIIWCIIAIYALINHRKK